MSLIGSLEDLGLGEVLQILSLSQKSGLLSVRGDDGEGIIVLRDGLVLAAQLKGKSMDLRAALVGGRCLDSQEFDHAGECARREGTSLEEALAAHTSLTSERIDLLRRDCVEAAVIAMFMWQTGEFSFDSQGLLAADAPPFTLPNGINAQYLAMEGTRIKDESLHRSQDKLHETAVAAVAEKSLELAQEPERALRTGSRNELPTPGVVGPSFSHLPLVVIDPDLVALEWVKQALVGSFRRIHLFQRWDLGLGPIRQYLASAERPVVLLQPGAQGDSLSGIRNKDDFVARLKSQQSSLPVVWLPADDGPAWKDFGLADGAVTRPSSPQLCDPDAAAQLEQRAEQLRQDLATVLSRCDLASVPVPVSQQTAALKRAAPVGPSPNAAEWLEEATALLAASSSRSEVLAVAIRFAREIFDRVALFRVERDSVVGIAQHGLASAGGPGDEELGRVVLDRAASAWVRDVLEGRRAIRAARCDGGHDSLTALLGRAAPQEAYLAPLESDGVIVAVLYADNLSRNRPLGDTEALERVLQQVGLALEPAGFRDRGDGPPQASRRQDVG
jgi:hypothetical protein